ncbi:MAG: hypothetical protein PHE09_08540 [Oscillospiraceae bacterium]|nr:hypothetical protein [Oscillospiraceae bacterium]
MKPFEISKENEKISSINRTIRLKPEIFEKLMLLSEEHQVSFNKLINQCIEYALDNMTDGAEK